jgi:hypothetical protein
LLEKEVETLLQEAALNPSDISPKAIIVPHAGYIYSGPTAAIAYVQLAKARQLIRRVVLLGPVHRVAVRGLALPGVEAFETPLGLVELDREAIGHISKMPQVTVSTVAHAQEHSLEVQLPFLQTVLEDFKLIPLAVGDASQDEVAAVLEKLWGGPETLIVISSDLSHFLPYFVAQSVDQQTVQRILNLSGPLNHDQACGGTPINGLMVAAERHHLRPQFLDYRNSGDTAGDKSKVVGYTSIAFMEDEQYAH